MGCWLDLAVDGVKANYFDNQLTVEVILQCQKENYGVFLAIKIWRFSLSLFCFIFFLFQYVWVLDWHRLRPRETEMDILMPLQYLITSRSERTGCDSYVSRMNWLEFSGQRSLWPHKSRLGHNSRLHVIIMIHFRTNIWWHKMRKLWHLTSERSEVRCTVTSWCSGF